MNGKQTDEWLAKRDKMVMQLRAENARLREALPAPAVPWAFNDRSVCAHGVDWNEQCEGCSPPRESSMRPNDEHQRVPEGTPLHGPVGPRDE